MPGAPAKNQPHINHSWDTLFQEALRIAQKLVKPLYWRGSRRGVLPQGYDPASLASETILDLLKARHPNTTAPPAISSSELRRRIWRRIDRLHHRKENALTIDAPDLAPAPARSDEGQPTPLLSLTSAPGLTPLELLLQKEQLAEFELFQSRFKARLGRRHRLRLLFDFLCEGISKPADLARRLKLRAAAIPGLKRSLRRFLLRFPSPNLRTNGLSDEKK